MSVRELPYVDAHSTTIEAPVDVVWPRLTAYVDRTLASGSVTVLTRLLGARPGSGFAVTEQVKEERLVLEGRHRFSTYALVLLLEPARGRTVLRAQTWARFPGPHGRVYRLLVISSRAHVVATRGILASMAKACEG